MADQNLIDRLDTAIDAILAGRREGLVAADPDLATLLVVAGDLRDLPDPAFKRRLKEQLIPNMKENTMTIAAEATALQSVIPYLVVRGASGLIDFMKTAFGAEERMRAARPDGAIMHAEMRIGDATVELADANEQYPPAPAAIHLYVPNVDELHARAVRAGATPLYPITDQPYGDREGSVRDAFGNHWYIATHQATGSAPEGFRNATPYLHAAGAETLIDFLKNAFGAEEIERTPGPEGRIMHATYRIGNAMVELSEAHGQWGPMPMHLHLFVQDVEGVYTRAMGSGATSIFSPETKPYGEYMGAVQDGAGNQWYIARKVTSSS
jgi:PhnB protein